MYQEGHPVQLFGNLLTWQHGATATAATRCGCPIATESAAISTAAATIWQWSGDPEHATTHAAYVSDAPNATASTNAATSPATITSEHVVVFSSFTRTDAFASYAVQRDDRTSTTAAATTTATASKPTPASTTAPSKSTSKSPPTASSAAITINEHEYGCRYDATTHSRQHNVRLPPRQDDASDDSTTAAAAATANL